MTAERLRVALPEPLDLATACGLTGCLGRWGRVRGTGGSPRSRGRGHAGKTRFPPRPVPKANGAHRSASPMTEVERARRPRPGLRRGALDDGRRRLERGEARGAELHAPGPRAAVRDDVAPRLAARRLDDDVDLALGDAVALGDDLEVVDQRLHRGVELVARGEHDLAVVRDPRLARPSRRAGRGTAGRCARTRASRPCAPCSGRRRRRSGTPGRRTRPRRRRGTACSSAGPSRPRRRGASGPDCPSASASSAESRPIPFVRSSQIALPVEDRLVLVDRLRHRVAERPRLVGEAGREVLGEPAHLDVARVQPRAARQLEEVEDGVAVVERVPEHRDRPELEGRRAEPDEVRVDAVQLGERHPRPGRAPRAPRSRAASRSRARTRARSPGTRGSRSARGT